MVNHKVLCFILFQDIYASHLNSTRVSLLMGLALGDWTG